MSYCTENRKIKNYGIEKRYYRSTAPIEIMYICTICCCHFRNIKLLMLIRISSKKKIRLQTINIKNKIHNRRKLIQILK